MNCIELRRQIGLHYWCSMQMFFCVLPIDTAWKFFFLYLLPCVHATEIEYFEISSLVPKSRGWKGHLPPTSEVLLLSAVVSVATIHRFVMLLYSNRALVHLSNSLPIATCQRLTGWVSFGKKCALVWALNFTCWDINRPFFWLVNKITVTTSYGLIVALAPSVTYAWRHDFNWCKEMCQMWHRFSSFSIIHIIKLCRKQPDWALGNGPDIGCSYYEENHDVCSRTVQSCNINFDVKL